jgi:predicted RNase H-like HicB family nuclease
MRERRYPVIIEQTGTGYSAYSSDVSGCAAVGDRKEETRRNFPDALSAHFEVMREIGEPIPDPNATVDYVEVAALHPVANMAARSSLMAAGRFLKLAI